MIQKINYLVVVAFFLSACTEGKNDFTGNETNITGIKLDVGCMVGQPSSITYLDPLLLFFDRYDNTCVTVFDTKNKQFVRRFVKVGQGPDEVLPPLRLFASPIDQKIYMFQFQAAKLNIYDPGGIIEYDRITPLQLFFEDRPPEIKKIKDGYIGSGPFEDGRFRLYDSDGHIVSAFGKYPFHGEDMDRIGRFFIYQGHLATSVDGKYFAIGSSYCDNLEFYKIEDGVAILKKKYETYDVKGSFVGNMIQLEDNCIMNYKAAYGGGYCYMLYSGETLLEKNGQKAGGSKIIVFDWEGNYLKSYKTNIEILSFCIDEENQIMYAAARDKNDEDGGGFNVFQFNL